MSSGYVMKPLEEALGDTLLEEAGGQMLLERGLGAARETRRRRAPSAPFR